MGGRLAASSHPAKLLGQISGGDIAVGECLSTTHIHLRTTQSLHHSLRRCVTSSTGSRSLTCFTERKFDTLCKFLTAQVTMLYKLEIMHFYAQHKFQTFSFCLNRLIHNCSIPI